MFLLLAVLLLLPCAAWADKPLPVQAFKIGASYKEIEDLLSNNHALFEEYENLGRKEIYCHIDVFGFFDEFYGTALIFDENENLESIETSLENFDTVMGAYNHLSSYLGKADIVSQPAYVDSESDSDYTEYQYMTYIVWQKEEALYELEVCSRFTATYKNNLLSGLEVKVSDSVSQWIDLNIYAPDALDDQMRMYTD